MSRPPAGARCLAMRHWQTTGPAALFVERSHAAGVQTPEEPARSAEQTLLLGALLPPRNMTASSSPAPAGDGHSLALFSPELLTSVAILLGEGWGLSPRSDPEQEAACCQEGPPCPTCARGMLPTQDAGAGAPRRSRG